MKGHQPWQALSKSIALSSKIRGKVKETKLRKPNAAFRCTTSYHAASEPASQLRLIILVGPPAPLDGKGGASLPSNAMEAPAPPQASVLANAPILSIKA